MQYVFLKDPKHSLTYVLQNLCEDSVSLVGMEQQRGSDMLHRGDDDTGQQNNPG